MADQSKRKRKPRRSNEETKSGWKVGQSCAREGVRMLSRRVGVVAGLSSVSKYMSKVYYVVLNATNNSPYWTKPSWQHRLQKSSVNADICCMLLCALLTRCIQTTKPQSSKPTISRSYPTNQVPSNCPGLDFPRVQMISGCHKKQSFLKPKLAEGGGAGGAGVSCRWFELQPARTGDALGVCQIRQVRPP